MMGEYVLAFLLGAIAGSFLNVCIYRLPRDISLTKPARSICPHCGSRIPWMQNIPLLSWVLLRGRCASCKRPIGWRYPLVELLTALLYVWTASIFQFPVLLPALVLISLLVAITFIDIEFFIIPDLLSKGGLAAGLLFSILIPQLHRTSSVLVAAERSAAGALCGGLILYLITELGKLAFGRYKVSFDSPKSFSFEIAGDGDPRIIIDGEAFTWSDHFFRNSDRILLRADEASVNGKQFRNVDLKFFVDRLVSGGETAPLADLKRLYGKTRYAEFPREAMGLGDVKLMAAIGAFTGWQGALFTIPAASVLGAAIGLATIAIGKREWSTKIPFGPYLAAGVIVWLFYGHRLLNWYRGLLT